MIENQSIYYIICNIQISPHNFDPARLLSIRLLHSLNRSMWVAIFPQKATTTVCLGFCINPSSTYDSRPLGSPALILQISLSHMRHVVRVFTLVFLFNQLFQKTLYKLISSPYNLIKKLPWTRVYNNLYIQQFM